MDDLDDEAVLESCSCPHVGAVNRLRVMPQAPHIVATWSSTGRVHMWNMSRHASSFAHAEHAAAAALIRAPLFTCAAHAAEGFALDWSLTTIGRCAHAAVGLCVCLWG